MITFWDQAADDASITLPRTVRFLFDDTTLTLSDPDGEWRLVIDMAVSRVKTNERLKRALCKAWGEGDGV